MVCNRLLCCFAVIFSSPTLASPRPTLSRVSCLCVFRLLHRLQLELRKRKGGGGVHSIAFKPGSSGKGEVRMDRYNSTLGVAIDRSFDLSACLLGAEGRTGVGRKDPKACAHGGWRHTAVRERSELCFAPENLATTDRVGLVFVLVFFFFLFASLH